MKLPFLPALALLAFTLLLDGQAKNDKAPKSAPANPQDTRITLDVSRVNMLFTVSDKKGRFITDLTKDDFEVFESKKPQSIIEFASETDLPLRLAILIDTSNSIRERFHFQQEAATAFIDSTVRPREDKAMVVSFDTAAELVTDLTDNISQLEKAVQSLRPGGGTSLYDAVFFACREKLMQDQPLYKFRRAMVVLSDGEDNQSHYTRDQALEMAQKADVTIYTISTNITHIETDGDKVLRYFASETGGQVFFPFKATDLNQSFENISNELRHQYNVFYRPEPLKVDGLYHAVDIRVKNRKDLIVRCRKGYYAPKL
jgi:Ca-activated chloride channel family protein